jgi:hypothetical protein
MAGRVGRAGRVGLADLAGGELLGPAHGAPHWAPRAVAARTRAAHERGSNAPAREGAGGQAAAQGCRRADTRISTKARRLGPWM